MNPKTAWLLILILAAAGCQPIESFRRSPADVTPRRELRKAEASEQFGRKREMAEFRVAQEQWDRGDLAGCDATLRRLLKRNPDHLDARLLLAELRIDQGRSSEAVADLQPLAEAHAEDARIQHLLALALDASGDTEAAVAYYAKAVQLEPANELYRLSHDGCIASTASPASYEAPAVSRP